MAIPIDCVRDQRWSRQSREVVLLESCYLLPETCQHRVSFNVTIINFAALSPTKTSRTYPPHGTTAVWTRVGYIRLSALINLISASRNLYLTFFACCLPSNFVKKDHHTLSTFRVRKEETFSRNSSNNPNVGLPVKMIQMSLLNKLYENEFSCFLVCPHEAHCPYVVDCS